jgi:hypothetical protein
MTEVLVFFLPVVVFTVALMALDGLAAIGAWLVEVIKDALP